MLLLNLIVSSWRLCVSICASMDLGTVASQTKQFFGPIAITAFNGYLDTTEVLCGPKSEINYVPQEDMVLKALYL